MGSIGREMLPGAGDWSFGVAGWIYQPFIKGLEDFGYRREQNLFICYYDWRRSIEEIVHTYLIPTLKRVEEKYPNQPVDIVAHSMGGIVARTYIQGNMYQQQVEKFIMMGTPNHGTIDAYYLWSTGMLPPIKKKSFSQIIYHCYIWLLRRLLKIPTGRNQIGRLHESFPALGQLIPSQGYGAILCYEDAPGKWVMIPRGYIQYQNSLLDQLNSQSQLLKSRVKDVYCYCGEGSITNQILMVDKNQLVYHGQEMIIKPLQTTLGDGTVTVESASIYKGEERIIQGNHHGVLTRCLSHIAEIYGVQTKEVQIEEEQDTLHLLFDRAVDFTLSTKGGIILSYNSNRVNTSHDYMIQGDSEAYRWIVLKNIPTDEYNVFIHSDKTQDVSLLIMGPEIEAEYSGEVERSNYQRFATFNYVAREKGID